MEVRKVSGGRVRRKSILAGLLCGLLILSNTGCGAGEGIMNSTLSQDEAVGADRGESNTYTAGGRYDVDASYEEEEAGVPSADSDSGTPKDARKLIQKVTLEVETKEFEQLMWAVDGLVKELGGYIESMNTYNGSSYSGSGSRYSNLTVRIPQVKLSEFLDTVSNAGNIVRRSENVDDVTLSYVDMESRRNVLRSEQERLLEFMDRAETIEEIIIIEERLSEVRYQLESMESQLRTIDNLVDYSTVNLNISEVKELTPVEEPTIGQRISEGFWESIEEIENGLTEFGIWFLVNTPYFVLWITVLAVVILLLRRRRRRLVREKEAKNRNTEEQKMQTGMETD